jgi:hypothetical protein
VCPGGLGGEQDPVLWDATSRRSQKEHREPNEHLESLDSVEVEVRVCTVKPKAVRFTSETESQTLSRCPTGVRSRRFRSVDTLRCT